MNRNALHNPTMRYASTQAGVVCSRGEFGRINHFNTKQDTGGP